METPDNLIVVRFNRRYYCRDNEFNNDPFGDGSFDDDHFNDDDLDDDSDNGLDDDLDNGLDDDLDKRYFKSNLYRLGPSIIKRIPANPGDYRGTCKTVDYDDS
jgi:hypothetical protein